MKVIGERPLGCFVSFNASSSEDASRVTKLLQELGVDTYRPDLLVGKEIGREIMAAMQAADFICLIIGDISPSPNVTFEAGLAIGLGKPVLTITTVSNVPFDFATGVQSVRVKDGDIASVRKDIERFVRHVRPRPTRKQAVPAPLQKSVQGEWDSLRKRPSIHEREAGLVDLVAGLFKQHGSEVLREGPGDGPGRVDLLVWNDPIVAELGGPLIVECKCYGGGSGSVLVNARHAFKQLISYVEQSSAKLGLLVFDHDRPTNISLVEQETPEALAFFVGDLIAAIETCDLPNEIRRRRTRAALRANRGDAG